MSVTQIVSQVIETLSDSISDLMLLVIAWQEQNCAPPQELAARVTGVSQSAMAVQNVARSLADNEYGQYPDIRVRVVDAADTVTRADTVLNGALKNLMSPGGNLEEGWNGLVKAIKDISGETIKLLQIVYGAEREKAFRAAEEALDALAKVNPDDVDTVPKEFVAAVSAAATKAAQLGAILQGKAQDTDSPQQKQELLELGQKLRTDAQGLITDVNKLLKDPRNEDLRTAVVRDLGALNQTIDQATTLLNEMNHEFDDAHSRFEDASRNMERSLEELERAKLATYAEDILVTAAKEKEAMNFVLDDLNDDDPDAARDSLAQVTAQQERLVKLAEMELGCVKDAGKRQQLQRIIDDLKSGFPAYERAANAAIAQPDNASARAQLNQQHAALESRINALEQFVENPGARLRAVARKEKEDLEKLAVAAEDQDVRNVSRAAKAVVAENKDVLAMARRQAGLTEDPVRRKQILDGCDELERMLPHNIMAAKAVLENPDDDAARAALKSRTVNTQAHIDALVENACPHPELELIAAVNLERQMVRQMHEDGKAGKAASVDQVAPRLTNNTQRIAELSRQIVTKFEDRGRKARLIDCLAKLDKRTEEYKRDTRALAGNASNPVLENKVVKGQAEIDRLLQQVLDETEAELFAEALRQKADLHALANAMQEGDPHGIAVAAQTVAKRQANLAALARASARRTEDPLKRKQMLDDIDELDMFLPDAVRGAAGAANDPSDEEAKRRLAESVMMMDSLLGDMMGGAVSERDSIRGKRSGQEAMSDGLLELQALMPDMMLAAQALAKDPSEQNRSRMEQLLTQMELEALSNNKGQLARAIRTHNENIAELCAAAERGDKPGTARALERVNASHQEVVNQARAMASACEDPLRRKKMMDAADELDMLLPMMGAAANAVAADPTSSKKREDLREIVRRVHHSEAVIAQAACLTPEIIVADSASREQDALKRLQAACTAGDVPGQQSAFKDVEQANRSLVEAARQCASGISDPVLHKRVMENIVELERMMPNLGASTERAARNPADKLAQQKASQDIVKTSQLVNRIVADTRSSPIAVCQQEDALLQQLARNITAVSAEAAQDVQAFQKKHLEMRQVVGEEMKKMTNPQRRQAIATAIERMDKFIPNHIQSAMKVLQAPGDNAARENFNTTNLHLRAGLASIIAALRPNMANVANNDRQQGALLLAQLRDTCRRGDEANSEKVLTAIAPVSGRLAKAARDYAARGGSPKDSEALVKAAARIEQLQATLPQVARAARSNPRDEAKQQALASHTRQMEELYNAVADTIGAPSNSTRDGARRRLNALLSATRSGRIDSQRFVGAAKDLADYINGLGGAGGDINTLLRDLNKYSQTAAPLRPKAAGDIDDLLSFLANIGSDEAFQPKTWDEMIQKVANDVKKAAGSNDSDPVMKVTRLIGLELAKIAKAAKDGDRTGMVQGGRDAARAVNQLIAILKPLADRCRDPRTRDRLLRTIQAMKNYSTQLKILCAVKAGAAIGEQDADTQGQLVAVTKSLGKTLTESVDTVKTMRAAKFV